MREHTYEVQKGQEVRAEFVGKKVTWQKATTIDEALTTLKHFDSEAALVAAAEQQRDIAVREEIRGALGPEGDGWDEALNIAATLVVGAPRTASGKVRAVKPQTKQKNAAAAAGNKIFEGWLAKPELVDRMKKLGAIGPEEIQAFEDWKAARTEAQNPAPTQAPQA